MGKRAQVMRFSIDFAQELISITELSPSSSGICISVIDAHPVLNQAYLFCAIEFPINDNNDSTYNEYKNKIHDECSIKHSIVQYW